jgi:hypothetical protein
MSHSSYEHAVIGKDISWKEMSDSFLRIIKFTPLATVGGGEVQGAVSHLPYAIVEVECIELDQRFVILVTHKIDFLNLWKAYNQRGISEEEEVIVGDFASKRTGFIRVFGAFLPRLFVWICRKGHLERLVNDNWGDLYGEALAMAMLPLEMWEPPT